MTGAAKAVGILTGGEVPERLNGPVLKTGGRKSRGFESHPLRHVRSARLWPVVLLAALLVAACSFLPGRQFVFGFPADGDAPELRGVLTDQTGAVTKVTTVRRLDPAPPIPRGMMTFADRPNVILAHWLGGLCDESVAIAVTPEGGVTITVTTVAKEGACDLVAIPRFVLIEFASPVDANRTTVRFEP